MKDKNSKPPSCFSPGVKYVYSFLKFKCALSDFDQDAILALRKKVDNSSQ